VKDDIEYLNDLVGILKEVEDGDDLTLGTEDIALFAEMLQGRVAVLERRRAWRKARTAILAAMGRRPEAQAA
jgi:hypothetical protein